MNIDPPILPFSGQLYALAEIDGEYDPEEVRTLTSSPILANLITSLVAGQPGIHRPVLDIDIPAALIPSSTPGHFHLYIDKAMPWTTYVVLLHALAAAGIVEHCYVSASLERGHTAVRLPWIKKEAS